ncbi:MAG: Xaa-Pro peptidase family protein [Desulfosalsimonadaceae bacterium]
MESSHIFTPPGELCARREKLQQYMQDQDIDGALILQNADLFYFSGTIQQGQLYIPAEGEPVLMIRKDFERAKSESSLPQVISFRSPRQLPEILKKQGISLPAKLGMELDVLPAGQYLAFTEILEKTRIVDISRTIRLVRAVKSSYEISLIREAVRFSDHLAGFVPEVLREGMTEVELAGRIEAEARRCGHQGLVRMRLFGGELFYGHVMAGWTAAEPSYLASPTGGAGVSPAMAQGASLRPISRHEPVLLDLVFVLGGYISDHTRIFSIGDLPDDLAAAHNVMLEVQDMVKQAARPGVQAGDLYEMALAKAEDQGLGEYFMGAGDQRIRFVGHGVGLELDEFPFLARGQKLALEAGMVIALEPKAIFPGRGVVGIENTHVVRENGLEQFGVCPESVKVL